MRCGALVVRACSPAVWPLHGPTLAVMWFKLADHSAPRTWLEQRSTFTPLGSAMLRMSVRLFRRTRTMRQRRGKSASRAKAKARCSYGTWQVNDCDSGELWFRGIGLGGAVMEEPAVYQSGNILITKSLARFGAATYPIASIGSVTVDQDMRALGCLPFILVGAIVSFVSEKG